MKKNIKLVLIELFIIFIFVFFLPPILIREKEVINKSEGQAVFNLSQKQTFIQKINQHSPNLNSISLHFKNPEIKNKSLIKVEINNLEGVNLKTFTFSGANIGDPSWVKLKFSPLNISTFTIKISAEKSRENLYLYVNNNQLDLITTSYIQGFKNRFLENINFQKTQIQQRSHIHNFIYLITIITLNILLFKRTSKKLSS